MANLSITAANVVASSVARIERGTSGATVTAGQVVYLDAVTTGKWQLADADAVTAPARGQGKTGIALNGASDGQPLAVLTGGPITIGATLTPGTAYYLSDDPGMICPLADVTGGDYYVLIGMATSASALNVDIQYSGVASA